MESSQLRRFSIIGLSILCLSPLNFFSNNLFDNEKDLSKDIVLVSDVKLASNHLSSNYEIFNPNIKSTSDVIEKLISDNKKLEVSDSENNLESGSTKNLESTEQTINNEKKDVVDNSVKYETSTSTKNSKKEALYTAPKSNTVKKKVVETPTQKKEVKISTQENTTNVSEKKEVVSQDTEGATSLVGYAKQFVGRPYRYGGTDLYNGVDCSGFTMKVYEHFGYSLPHSSASQSSYGRRVSLDQLAPGDLIFYGYNGSISHVAIYIGDGRIVHAANSSTGIVTASYTMMPIITARRILN